MLHTVTNHGPSEIIVAKPTGEAVRLLPRQAVTCAVRSIVHAEDSAARYSVSPSNLLLDLRRAEFDRKQGHLLGILVLDLTGAQVATIRPSPKGTWLHVDRALAEIDAYHELWG